MQKGQTTENREKGIVGPLEAYHILVQRQLSEDRIVTERTTIFLLASSVLFLAFVALLNPNLTAAFKVLRIALPILGLFLTAVVYGTNRAALNALSFWHMGERKIEEEAPEFAYMRENELSPHIYGEEYFIGKQEWKRSGNGNWALVPMEKRRSWLRKPILAFEPQVRYFPLVFTALWLISLAVAVID